MSLSVKQLSYFYKNTQVLEKISFRVDPGTVTAILGPNGVGKTTLLKCLNRILTPGPGQVFLHRSGPADLTRMTRPDIAREIGYVAQQNTGAGMTVFDAVLMGRLPHSGRQLAPADLEKADAVLDRLNLSGLGLTPLDRLSGGERQMVAIARAVVQETRVMLLDEPTASLDLKNQLEILALIRSIARQHRVAVVMTLHDLNSAIRHTDRFICLKDRTLFDAGPIDTLTAETVRAVYGVDVDILFHKGSRIIVPRSCPDAA